MGFLRDGSVHLVLTSPPYWTLKPYPRVEGQLGAVGEYGGFLASLSKVWRETYRLLVPGGRLVVVVGDVLLSRRRFGRHFSIPLHADVIRQCVDAGFDYLSPIIWYKIGNVNREMPGRGFLGKPYQPNAIIKNDVEYVLLFRKPGYRRVSRERKLLSVIPERKFREWARQVWRLPGARPSWHPAPFPLELAERLVRLFSYAGDVVLDPFLGSGTTMLAALRWGRSSVGVEVVEEYAVRAYKRLRREAERLAFQAIVGFCRLA